MTSFAKLLGAAAMAGTLAVPAAAQYYPQPGYSQTYPGYPQTYPQQTYPGYGQPYGYGQGYGQNAVGDIIDQLLGNRYNVTDRQAVRRCANAAAVQAQNQYRGYGGGYGGYGYRNQGFAPSAMRVTAITDVQRRSNGLRVRGLISTGYGGGGGYGGYGYGNQGYAGGDLSFRCTVDYRGYVSDIRIGRNDRRY
jgi:hypothetical protein